MTCSWTAARPTSPRFAATFRSCPGSTFSRSSSGCSGAASAPPWSGRGKTPPAGFGHQRLGLGVGVDNPGARRLYERLGYADWGHGTIVGTWVERDRDRPPVTVSERLHLLVKALPGHGPS